MARRLILSLILSFLFAGQAFAALSANSILELNNSATANNVNGGGFNPSNANMLTDLTTDANTANTNSPVVSSASYNFVANDVGHWLYIKSGTNWTPGWYQIASVASNKATLSAAVGQAIQTNSTKGSPAPKYQTNTVAGCATVGTPTSGVFTIDYSQGTTAILNLTDGACTTPSTTFTSATGGFTKMMIGNFLHITAITGTGTLVGWYEIVNVTDTNTVTLDRTPAPTNNGSAATFYVGGAMSLNSTLDDDLFEIGVGTNGTGGMRFFVKNGSYTLGEAVSIAASGGTQAPIVVEGYNSTRGDIPAGSTRPTITGAANAFTAGTNWDFYNLIWTGSAAAVWTGGSGGKIINCKFINTSSTTGRDALFAGGGDTLVFNNEAISYWGRGIRAFSSSAVILSNYSHDSDVGLGHGNTTSDVTIEGNIIADNVTAAISFTSADTDYRLIKNNTLYGAENKLGTGVNLATGNTDVRLLNNIIYGFVTGVSHADVQTVGYDDYNDYNNNTTDVSNWQKGTNDVTTAPTFTNVTQVPGTTGAFVAGNNKLVDTNKNFTMAGVAAGDIVYISGGTGATTRKYLIDSISTTTNPNDTLNITIPAGPGTDTTANKTYQITLGHNFAIGTNLKALGFPGAFQGGTTTGYMDIGGVQRQEPAGGGGTSAHTFVGGF